jgi:hypothetical protein
MDLREIVWLRTGTSESFMNMIINILLLQNAGDFLDQMSDYQFLKKDRPKDFTFTELSYNNATSLSDK